MAPDGLRGGAAAGAGRPGLPGALKEVRKDLFQHSAREIAALRAASSWAPPVLAALLLSACAQQGGYYKDDGPPDRHPVDIQSIPDAVPRDDPRSEIGNDPYEAFGRRYVPMADAGGYRERGTASWYGKKFHGEQTASGEEYDMFAMTAAHRTLPLPSYVLVTNLRNGKDVVVKVNDRGPFLRNRLIDLSYAAAFKLGIIGKGTSHVEVSAVSAAKQRAVAAERSTSGTAGSGDTQRFYVQFGAFSRSANARSLIRELHAIGIRFAHVRQGDDGFYRVRSGPFSAASTAEYFGSRGADHGLNTTIVTE